MQNEIHLTLNNKKREYQCNFPLRDGLVDLVGTAWKNDLRVIFFLGRSSAKTSVFCLFTHSLCNFSTRKLFLWPGLIVGFFYNWSPPRRGQMVGL